MEKFVAVPHPRNLIALLSSTLRNIEDAVNGSIAATSISPSTEGEAFLYNLARDRGVAGAFGAASTFGPAAPQFVRTGRYAASRPIPQALGGGGPSPLNGPGNGNPPGLGAPPSPDRLRANSGGWPSSSGSVPSVPAPTIGAAPSGGLLGRLRELEALERPGTNTGLPAPKKDPNFRRLSRFPVLPTLESAGSVATDLLDIPDFLRRVPKPQIPDSVVSGQADKPLSTSSSGGGNGVDRKGGSGGGGGGDDGGGNHPGQNHKDLCDEELNEELRRCESYRRDSAHPHYFSGCKARAKDRWVLCYKNDDEQSRGGPREWRPGTDKWPGDEETYRNYSR
jgi:uncharacterized membrane protein YgcG